MSKKNRQANTPRSGLKPGQLGWLAFLLVLALGAIAGLGFTLMIYPPPAGSSPLAEGLKTGDFQSTPSVDEDTSKTEITYPSTPELGTQPPTPNPTQTATPRPTSTATPTAILMDLSGPVSATAPSTYTPVPTLTPILRYWRTVIGESVEGLPLVVHSFGEGDIERMIVAGIHGGGEWNTIALANELIAYVKEHGELLPANTSLFILPALNPDGEARAHGAGGRANANGVDLNRNWDAGWQAHWPRFGCWNLRPTTGGAYPASEPETQALMKFIQSHHVDVLISYHSAALGIFPSGVPADPGSVRFAQAIAEITPYRYPPVRTGCAFSGTLVDWALTQGAIGVDLELRNHLETDFEINLKVLSLLLNWQP